MTMAAHTVAGVPNGVAEARGWVAQILCTAGYESRLVEHSVAVTSELVTNAVRYTDGRVRVELLTGVCRVRVSVIDAGTETSEPTVPRARPDPDNAEAARGLYLVDLWAERLVIQGGPRGRTVSADIAAPSAHDAVDEAAVVLPKREPQAGANGHGRRRSA